MTSDEERLRQLKSLAEQRQRDYDAAVARAYAMRDRLAEILAELKEDYGCESLEEAEKLIEKDEAEMATMLADLEETLA